jgi:ribosomal protein S8
MLNDTLANALSKILNDEQKCRSESLIKPCSKIIKKVLEVMMAY